MIHHILWDFDGTLFDTYPHMARAFQRALNDLAHPTPMEEILRQIKRSVTVCVRHFEALYGLQGELSARYRQHEQQDETDLVRPYAELAPLLRATSEVGIRHYVYTHRDASAMDFLRQFALDGYFTDAITANDSFPAKPAPDAILFLLTKHHIAPEDAAMIGDRDIDILAARNAGIAGCLFDPDHFYDAFTHDWRVPTLAQLQTQLLG
ncbi:MAG: HAD-IA family hydrolase [Clostridia bacterium]